MQNGQNGNYNIVIHIFNCKALTSTQTDFLSKLLFLSKYNNSFEINRSLVEICPNTKLKKTFVDDSPSEILIYYKIPTSDPPLETLQSDFINIISSKQDKRYYDQLDHDIRFSIVGVRTVSLLSIPQITYMNNLIKKYKNNLISATTPNSNLNHYKKFHNGI